MQRGGDLDAESDADVKSDLDVVKLSKGAELHAFRNAAATNIWLIDLDAASVKEGSHLPAGSPAFTDRDRSVDRAGEPGVPGDILRFQWASNQPTRRSSS